jgi:hypothetical protein
VRLRAADVEATVASLRAKGVTAYGAAVDVSDKAALEGWVADAATAIRKALGKHLLTKRKILALVHDAFLHAVARTDDIAELVMAASEQGGNVRAALQMAPIQLTSAYLQQRIGLDFQELMTRAQGFADDEAFGAQVRARRQLRARAAAWAAGEAIARVTRPRPRPQMRARQTVVVFAAGCSEIERGFMMAAVGGDRGALDSAGR